MPGLPTREHREHALVTSNGNLARIRRRGQAPYELYLLEPERVPGRTDPSAGSFAFELGTTHRRPRHQCPTSVPGCYRPPSAMVPRCLCGVPTTTAVAMRPAQDRTCL